MELLEKYIHRSVRFPVCTCVNLTLNLFRGATFENVVGFLNDRLAPALVICTVAGFIADSLGLNEDFRKAVLESWMRDEMAPTHTDLVLFSSNPSERCEVFMFSPLQTRPLGRQLPSVLEICSCKPDASQKGARAKRNWRVIHNLGNRKSKMLKDIRNLQVMCESCKKIWTLETEHMPGTLEELGGLYFVCVPYFV